jgi:tetratricopeptide (TPR) repeat protein
MGIVAGICLPVATQLTAVDLAGLIDDQAGAESGAETQAIEFEPALLRSVGDVRGYLLKVLGIQASFRGRHDEAVGYFRAIREVDGPISTEIRAQSHLYSALTLAKRRHQLAAAGTELDAGFAAVSEHPAESISCRRERGWLHNLRALTLFAQQDLVAALDHEKAALSCIDQLADASSVHLRVNLVSNISVLQERAGKFESALRTWDRLGAAGSSSDATFVKHHAYRAGGLRLRAGDNAEGLVRLSASLEHCVRLADDFHECEIAMELGTHLLASGDHAAASDRYDQAATAAARLGDPYRMALSEVGRSAAEGVRVGHQTALLAMESLTHPVAAQALAQGCQEGADPLTLLPAPRTKLNRPFDLINI